MELTEYVGKHHRRVVYTNSFVIKYMLINHINIYTVFYLVIKAIKISIYFKSKYIMLLPTWIHILRGEEPISPNVAHQAPEKSILE